jgi:hypothetical protein
MSTSTFSDNEGVAGHTSSFLGNGNSANIQNKEHTINQYRKILETLDECQKKRNEMRQQKRLRSPVENISNNEPNNITPFLEHPTDHPQQPPPDTEGTPVITTASKQFPSTTAPKVSSKFNIEGTLFHDTLWPYKTGSRLTIRQFLMT